MSGCRSAHRSPRPIWPFVLALLLLSILVGAPGCAGIGGNTTGTTGGTTTATATTTTGTTTTGTTTGSTTGTSGTIIYPAQGGTLIAGPVTLVIPPNALTKNTTVNVQAAPAPLPSAPAKYQILGSAGIELTPAGTQLSSTATLTISYVADSLPPGVDASSLTLDMDVSGSWQPLTGSTVNASSSTISAPISQFGTFAIITPQAVPVGYSVVDLGVLTGDGGSIPGGISSNGEVCGTSITDSGTLHAFLWAAGTLTNLGTRTGDTGAKAYAVNASGAAVGISLPSTSNAFPVEFANGTVTQLDTQTGVMGGGDATAINDAGQIVVGNSLNVNGVITQFPTNFTAASGSGALNASGQVAGTMSGQAAVVNSSGTVTLDGLLTGYPTAAGTAISDNGTLVGTASNAAGIPVGFIYSGGTMAEVPPIPGGTNPDNISEPAGVNNSGQVVGLSSQGFVTARAFLYQKGVTIDLNTQIPSNAGWTLRQAYGINNAGQIIVLGVSTEGVEHALLLNPASLTSVRRSPARSRKR